MALFIGRKPANNKPLVHLTSGKESLSILQGDPIGTTLFHSDIPYLAVHKMISVTQFRKVRTQAAHGQYDNWYVPVLPSSVISFINQGYIMTASRVRHSRAGYIESAPRGEVASQTLQVPGIFSGNFQGSSFASRNGKAVPYGGMITDQWGPLHMGNTVARCPQHADLAAGVRHGYTGDWSAMTGLATESTSVSTWPEIVATSDISRTASRGTTATYTPNDITQLEELFGTTVIKSAQDNAPALTSWSGTTPGAFNLKLNVYIFNVKYSSSNQVEHIKPNLSSGIMISGSDIAVGNLSIKSGMLISDEQPSVTNLNQGSSGRKFEFFNKLRNLSIEELSNYPFPYTSFFVNKENNTWGASGDVVMQVHAPSRALGSNVTLEFSADEIKYKGSRGEMLLASKSRNYSPFTLGGNNAITARFAPVTKNFLQLKNNATFKRQTLAFTGDWRQVLNPNECGNFEKTEVIAQYALPADAASKRFIQAHISPIVIKGETSCTIGGKKSRINAIVEGFKGWSGLKVKTFDRRGTTAENTLEIGNIGYSVIKDVNLTSSSGYWPFASTGNKMQSVRVRYSARIDWISNRLELVATYKLTNAAIRVHEYSGRTTYYNKLTETEVSYKLPEVKFGFYVMGSGN